MHEIITEDYSIKYDATVHTMYCQGFMRLNGQEYESISQLFDQVVAETENSRITINLQKLETLNSAGIMVLGKFVLGIDKKKTIQLLLQCSNEIPWQKKTIMNFKRLIPELELEWS